MASAKRMLRILGLFDLNRPVITPEWLVEQLGVSRASVYRDLGQLASAGMLERVPDRGYVLGPMVVELDRQIRLADPLLQAAEELLGRLAEETGGTAPARESPWNQESQRLMITSIPLYLFPARCTFRSSSSAPGRPG